MLALLITGLMAAAAAVLASRFELIHLHLLLVVPVGAMAMGAVVGGGVAMAIRVTRSYDTPGRRMLGTVMGLAAYTVAVVLEFTGQPVTLGPFRLPAASVLSFPAYLTRMVRAQGEPVTRFLEDAARDFPDVPATWFDGVTLDYERLRTQVEISPVAAS